MMLNATIVDNSGRTLSGQTIEASTTDIRDHCLQLVPQPSS